jgi:hypothetical protein
VSPYFFYVQIIKKCIYKKKNKVLHFNLVQRNKKKKKKKKKKIIKEKKKIKNKKIKES